MDFHDLNAISLSMHLRAERLDLSQPLSPIETLLRHLAELCSKEKGLFIGHIKGLALSPDGSYAAINMTSAGGPISRLGTFTPSSEAEFTVTVLVFGGSKGELESSVKEAIKSHLGPQGIDITWKNATKSVPEGPAGFVTFSG